MIADFQESAYQRQSSTPLEELWTVVDLTTGLRSGILIPTDPDAPGIFSTISTCYWTPSRKNLKTFEIFRCLQI